MSTHPTPTGSALAGLFNLTGRVAIVT